MERTILHPAYQASEIAELKAELPTTRLKESASPIIVIGNQPDSRTKTTAKGGLSPVELERLDACMHYLKASGCGAYLVFQAFHLPEEESRALGRIITNDIAKYQKRRNQKPLYLEVHEDYVEPAKRVPGQSGWHSNLVVIMPTETDRDWLVERLLSSKRYGHFLRKSGSNPRYDVWYWTGLRNYLAGECTTQAHYKACREFPRWKVEGYVGELGGDRVRPSDLLRDRLIRKGKITDYKRGYAKRPRPTKRRTKVPIGHQYELLSPAVAPPVSVVRLAEIERQERGMTQRELAARFGMGQAHYANCVRGHDKPGPWALNRVLDFIADRLAA